MWPFKAKNKKPNKFTIRIDSNIDELDSNAPSLPIVEDIKNNITVPTEYRIERMANVYFVRGYCNRPGTETCRAFNSPEKATDWLKQRFVELEKIINIEKLKQ